MISALTQEEFDERMRELHPNIEVTTPYKNSQARVHCICKIDGYEWETRPNKLLHAKHGCPKCGGSLALKTNEFKKQMEEINPEIEILGEYINSDTHIECKCKVCGHIWKARPYHLKRREGCPICAIKKNREKMALGMDEFKRKLKEIDPDITILSRKYTNTRTKVRCRCKVCGRKWEAMPLNLLKGRGCPSCTSSKSERKITRWLKAKKIKFEAEFRFEDCKNERPLPFDFYFPQFKLAIEYDGQHHFKPVVFRGQNREDAEKRFKTTQICDKIKDEYCKKNNIELIRINYKQYDELEEILEKIFKGRF